jgi:hypothetical protein
MSGLLSSPSFSRHGHRVPKRILHASRPSRDAANTPAHESRDFVDRCLLAYLLTVTACTTANAPAQPEPIQTLEPAPAAAVEPTATGAASDASTPIAVSTATNDPPEPQPPQTATVPPLESDAGTPLPQTDDLPSLHSESFRLRLELLVQAIEEDAPEVALPAFFPVRAYEQVKAIAKPERDWEHRLVAAFRRNIHEYHVRLGEHARGVKFARIEIAEPKVKYMKPHSEGNRLGYYRALRSQLVVTKADGGEAEFEVTSMISWRGEWYVVHLNGF